MGRLTIETERATRQYYENRKGLLIVIAEFDEAGRVSKLVDDYCCKTCEISCMAWSPVISLSEIDWSLRGSGLFAVGLLEVPDEENCPVIKRTDLNESGNIIIFCKP